MNKKRLKSNKGISMVDIIIAIVILSLFVGIVGDLYVKIASNNARIKMNAIATYYVVQIAEYIDKISYDDEILKVNNTVGKEQLKAALKENLKEGFAEWPEDITSLTMKVTNPTYKDTTVTRDDILKQVEITIKYNILGNEETYRVTKIKIKED